MKNTLITLILLFTQVSLAQNTLTINPGNTRTSNKVLDEMDLRESWHQGTLLLTSGDKIEGSLKYELSINSVVYNDNGTAKTYHASQLIGFTVYSKDKDVIRTFYSKTVTNSKGYREKIILESLLEGETNLFGREYVFYKRPYGMNRLGDAERIPELSYHFYIEKAPNNFVELGESRNSVAKAFAPNSKEIKKFMKRNKTDYRSLLDMMELIEYYNQL